MPSSSSHVDAPAGPGGGSPKTGVAAPASSRMFSRAATAVLLLVGIALGAVGFATVMSMGDMAWHAARDAELRATYDAYEQTGTLLIKETGSGSYGVQAPADGPLTFATWDDDPGSYIIASLMSHVTGSDSPYPGLKLAQALVVGIPLIWLPLAVARIVGRARAGYALVLLPLVIWLLNHGATLVGTEYGLSDRVSTLPVYSLYGTAASLAFLSLSLIVLLSAYRLKTVGLIAATLGISVLAALGNMSRSLSGMGVAVAIGVLWWLFAKGRWRWVSALAGAVVAVLLATVIQTGIMTAINVDRAETTGQAMTEVPDAHTAWHSLYLGLSYPTPLNGQPSHFDVIWSDEFGWEQAREVDPDVLIASEEYDAILKDLYLDEVLGDPVGAVKLYLQKALFLAKHFGGLLLFIAIGFAVGLSIRSVGRPKLGRVLAITAPLLLLGLVPAIMVMPMLYYYSELAASLGLLAAVSLGVIIWALTSWPARARAQEARRNTPTDIAVSSPTATSVVIDAASVGSGDVDRILAATGPDDEVIVVAAETGQTAHPAATRAVEIENVGPIGRRLRAAVLVSHGARVVIVADPLAADSVLPFPISEGPAAQEGQPLPARADERSRSRDIARDVLLDTKGYGGHRTFALDGDRARALARVSKEESELWLDEMIFGAIARGGNATAIEVHGDAPPTTTRVRFFPRLAGLCAIALRREEYVSARSL